MRFLTMSSLHLRGVMTVVLLMCFISPAWTADPHQTFYDQINNTFNAHFNKYKDTEFYSGAEMSIYVPGIPIYNIYAGRVARNGVSAPVTANTLFQIGSITKSFTSAVMLQLEKEKKLTLADNVGHWLPQYNKWSAIILLQLLNMTSGIPNYSDSPLWNAEEYANELREWDDQELINFVYPAHHLSPPLKTGYYYSNTGYIMAAMIIEKATSRSFKDELTVRTIIPADLKNTHYPVSNEENNIKTRLAHGYSFNQYDNPELVGRDTYTNNLSWAGAAGGLVSNAEDIVKWVKALFVDNNVLDAEQKKKLQSLISLADGKSIAKSTATHPHAFGLGVAQAYSSDKKLGNYWYYEGETLGYRALYMYNPCSGIIIATIFNSATNHENDHTGELMKTIYLMTAQEFAKKSCM